MQACLAECLGTALLVLLGNGVVANVVLQRTKGHGSGWMVICAGWAFAVFTAVACTTKLSGGHLNPAVTLGLALNGAFSWSQVPGYIAAQLVGAMAGALLVYVFYFDHYALTSDADAKLATFCTSPASRHRVRNFVSEAVGTAVLVTAALTFATPQFLGPEGETSVIEPGAIGAVPIALVVFSIGLSLGGTTGHAINPARDLGPRLIHAWLPIPGKRDSDWGYAAVPVLGPFVGAVAGYAMAQLLKAGLLPT